MEASNLPEFEFHFEDCVVGFEDGPKSYQDLIALLPVALSNPSTRLRCYFRSKATGLFQIHDEASFQNALRCGGNKVTFLLRQESEN